ncbi:MAG: DUF1427 family protein [Hyphomicrobium sp.]|uniref:DUF1427 family protein n=1 Tax=Hyphomicrobium sp. TaxID=82 RepID=UPI003D13D4CF
MDKTLRNVVTISAGLGLWAGAIAGLLNAPEPAPPLSAHLAAPYAKTAAEHAVFHRRACVERHREDMEAFRCEMDLERQDELSRRYAPYRRLSP